MKAVTLSTRHPVRFRCETRGFPTYHEPLNSFLSATFLTYHLFYALFGPKTRAKSKISRSTVSKVVNEAPIPLHLASAS